MKKNCIIIIICLGFLGIISCDKKTEEPKNVNNPNEKIITACGVTNPTKNIPWLVELIEKAETDKTGNYFGRIWLEKYNEQDIFVTDMMLGSGGVMYWYFDCAGNHLISKKWEYETCCGCNFVGNHHFFVENEEDFLNFTINMKLDILIYSSFK